MHKFFLIPQFIFIFYCSCLSQISPLNITKCWEYKTDYNQGLFIASDNKDENIFFQDGVKLISFNNKGNINWQNEIGNNFIAGFENFNKNIFLITQDSNLKFEIKIYTISLQTGIIIWENSLKLPETIDSARFIRNSKNLLVLINNKLIYKVNTDNKKIEQYDLLNFESKDIYQEDSNSFFLLDKDGKTLTKYNITNKSNELFLKLSRQVNKIYYIGIDKILYSDKNGNLITDKLTNSTQKWRFRTGGDIDSLIIKNELIFFTSLDNFIYCISEKSGNLVWKKRMSGRVKISLLNDKILVSSLINGQNTSFFEIKKGKLINQFNLSGDAFFTNKPEVNNNQILLESNKGIEVLSFIKCEKGGT